MRKLGWVLFASLFMFNACVKDDKVEPEAEKSSEKKIVSFKLSELSPEVVGVISEEGKTITAEVPSVTDITLLKPVVAISEGATVNPASNESVDFSNTVSYTVTAEDGSTIKYAVTITKAEAPLTINPITESTVKQRGGMFIITGTNFAEGSMEVYLFNDSKEYKMQVTAQSTESLTFLIIHEMELGNYNLKITDGTREAIADKEFTIEVESPVVSSISKTEVIQGEGFTITGEYFSTTKENNQVYLGDNEIDLVSATANELVVTVPGTIAVGEYTIKVVSNGKTTYYNSEKLTVIVDPTVPVITSINAASYTRGETIIITGENLKKTGVATNINFTPFIGGGATIVRSAVANDEGTQVTYTIPNDFDTGSYVIVIEVDFKYSEEYGDVIKINP